MNVFRQPSLLLLFIMILSSATYADHHETEGSAFSVDSTILDILRDDRAREVLYSYWPDAATTKGRQLRQAVGLTLRDIAGYGPQSGLDETLLEKLNIGLETLTINPEMVKSSFDSGLSADSTLGEILTDVKAKAVLVSYWPAAARAQIAVARNLTLRTVASYPEAELSADQLEQLSAALASLTINSASNSDSKSAAR
jgi:hypothetical protein